LADPAFILGLALVLDAIMGDPDWLWQRIPHPVVLFGWLIDLAEKIGNHPDSSGATCLKREAIFGQKLQQKQRDRARKRCNNRDRCSGVIRRVHGGIALIVLISLAAFIGWGLAWLCQQSGTGGIIIEAILASLFLAQRSLALHVRAVFLAYKNEGIESARLSIAKIVGRNPDGLDEAGICRAAIESLSENSSDGVIAPAFWFLLAGLPGILAYKMLNTADSMIGHKNARYGDFGYCAARLDDLANYLPARLTTLLVAMAAFVLFGRSHAKAAIIISVRDAKKHRSPNAGWPESAYAGALGVSLAGPRIYGAQKIEASFQNANAAPPCPEDIIRALSLFWGSMFTFFIGLLPLHFIPDIF